ncbi:hypothetical protein BFJ63_vAg16239 [Fusarium oxysporum f. sp. narcissi]|uniref:Uncharacterized protein n=1 Tax=Fusarium oxysporum f. sp. narcissi TaxID=451672 RepID=A0A4V1RYA0_FUSOX|nr:hypothetical protein BFJ63_vAg16239 [Fusarium oxysporum f. sp. narcissi]
MAQNRRRLAQNRRTLAQLTLPKPNTIEETRSDESSPLSELSKTPECPWTEDRETASAEPINHTSGTEDPSPPPEHDKSALPQAVKSPGNEVNTSTEDQEAESAEPVNYESDASHSSINDPDLDENEPSQPPATRGADETMFPGDILPLAGVDLRKDIRCILEYLVHDHAFYLYCELIDDRCGYVPEEHLQSENPFILHTFWESREDPEQGSVGRPHNIVHEKIFRVVPLKEAPGQCLLQLVGTPYLDLSDENKDYLLELKEKWQRCFRCPEIITSEEAKLEYQHALEKERERTPCCLAPSSVDVMIFSHRRNELQQIPRLQFFVLREQGRGEWIDEKEVEDSHPGAPLTYWKSRPGLRQTEARRKPRVPDDYLRILGHEVNRRILLTVELLGGEIRTMDASKLLRAWSKPTTEYLERNELQI